jgi:hypothetical protein
MLGHPCPWVSAIATDDRQGVSCWTRGGSHSHMQIIVCVKPVKPLIRRFRQILQTPVFLHLSPLHIRHGRSPFFQWVHIIFSMNPPVAPKAKPLQLTNWLLAPRVFVAQMVGLLRPAKTAPFAFPVASVLLFGAFYCPTNTVQLLHFLSFRRWAKRSPEC